MALPITIRVTNVGYGEVLPHSLALIEGQVVDHNSNPSSQSAVITVRLSATCLDWPVADVDGRFKALVQLSKGSNDIRLTYNSRTTLLYRLIYESPDVGGRRVRLLYVVCADDANGGRFQGPVDQPADRFTVESAARRILLGARLVQTFTAENMVRHGLPRRTFTLEDDRIDVCHVLTLDRSVERARTMSERDLWGLVRDTLAEAASLSVDDHRLFKYVAFLSFTRYVADEDVDASSSSTNKYMTHGEIVRMTEGHAALGGGGLALLGTGCLHTWAEDVSEIVARFTDMTPVDRRHLMDDSGYRGTHWACYATTLGALCHELGHTFGLGHTADDRGVMGRGFGDIHRMFVVVVDDGDADVKSKQMFYGLRGLHHPRIPADGACYWDFCSAAWLSYHKWFNAPQLGDSEQGPKLYNMSEIRARHGLRVVVVIAGGDRVIGHWEFTRGFGRPTFRLLQAAAMADKNGHRRLPVIKAIDTFGNILDTSNPIVCTGKK